jgi:lipid-A-disaccharide synthase
VKSLHLLVVAGDPSADRHGASLIEALRKKSSGLRVTALGGTHLQAAADQFLYPLVGIGGFGFLEPIAKIPQLWRVKKKIQALLKEDRPDMVIPMDYYGFNIHVAGLAHREGIPVIYYISPQVWASRPGRVQRLARTINRMLVIFPFEEAIYKKAGVPVTYVGHPLVEQVPTPSDPAQPSMIGLLPGSRPGVAERHLPILCETADRLHREFPEAQFRLFRPAELDESLYAPFLATRSWLRLLIDPTYEDRKRLTLAISVSGTAALESTLLGVPMIVMYKLSALTYWIARMLIRIPFIAIPNILANRAIIPEFIQEAAQPAILAAAAAGLLRSPHRLKTMRQELLELRQHLQAGGSDRAAEAILEEMSGLSSQSHPQKAGR